MAMAIIVGRDAEEKKRYEFFIVDCYRSLKALAPDLDIRVYPDLNDYNDIDFVLTWRPPHGLLAQLPHLKAIASAGAGVDHILADPYLPKQIPIVRIVDPHMARDITQYVLSQVLNWVKRLDHWALCQRQNRWDKNPPFNLGDKTVGVMGLGFLGQKVALALQYIGLKTIGWSQSPKNFLDNPCFTGLSEFNDFLSQTDILVCLLPLTPQTKNILNANTFAQLPKGAYLINLGRGEHLVEEDLLIALNSGQLTAACLDVFREEPLPPNHPFWIHPQIRITPHIASVTNPSTAIAQILDNYRRAMAGQPLLNQINLSQGY